MAMPGASNEESKDAVRGVLRGSGNSGRTAFLVIALVFLAAGIYGGSMLLSGAAAVAVVLAASAVARAAFSRREARRLARGAASPASAPVGTRGVVEHAADSQTDGGAP
jgi:membrane protein implicated in regulation of membrane protease activity